MITRISKLKNFSIFHDFSWETNLPEFKRFNLIYGWNRSGKTTISRVFASCEKKCTYDKDRFRQYPENGAFEIKTDSATITNTHVATTANIPPIKVFNKDFIDDNISFDPSSSCNPIIYVSEEDIESKKQLEQLEADKITLGKDYEDAKKNKGMKEEAKSSFLTGLGREIANILFDKTYNKTDAERRINNIGIDNFTDKILSDEDRKKYETISKSEEGRIQNLFQKYQFSFLSRGAIIDDFQKIFELTQKLLEKKVVSETLERLKDDQDLNAWVKEGFDLHKIRKEKENCLFCQKPFDDDFLSSLSKHFSKDYEDLQSTITELGKKLLELKKDNVVVKNEDLYPDLRGKYIKQAKGLNEVIGNLNSWLEESISRLGKKQNNPFSIITSLEEPMDFLTSYNVFVDELNNIVSEHNVKVKNHSVEVKKTREKLELHAIAVALSKQDYKKFERELIEAENKEKEALNAFKKNNAAISELEKRTSNIAKATRKINKQLKAFFGREEIQLELKGDRKGYIIKRDGNLANNLSEGEKTAIAFSYFIVKVEEKEFKIKDGIIFIDDPISSFDSNFIYHCFSLITTHFKDVKQLFISTHNFQLFNLTKEWLINKNNRVKKDNEKLKANNQTEKPIPCEFYMVENYIDSDVRRAKFVELDKTLRNYKSE